MKGWETVRLGDCMDFLNGFAFKSQFFTDDKNDLPLIKGENLGKGRILWEASKYWKKEEAEKHKKYILKANDIVLAMDRPWVGGALKYAFISEKDPTALLVQRVGCIRANGKSCQPFLRYVVASEGFGQYIKGIMGGVAVPHISPQQIKSYSFLLPPIPTQRRIASILTAYDDGIENNLRRIRLLEEVSQRTFEEWFVRFRVGGVPLELDEGTGLPRGWVRKGLGELGDYLNGYPFKPAELGEKGYPIIKIKELKNGVVADTPRNSGETIAKRYFVERGELLFSWSASLEVVLWQNEKGLLNQHLFKVTPKNGIPKSFLFLSLKDSLPIFSGLTTGSTMKHIKRKELDFVTVCVPTEPELEKFDKSIQPVLDLISNLNRQNAHLKTARDLLLPRLMTGEIEVGEEVSGK